MQRLLIIVAFIGVVACGIFLVARQQRNTATTLLPSPNSSVEPTPKGEVLPFFIEELRKRQYKPSDIVIEETLPPGSNYNRYIASYSSDGLKIYGLFTVPLFTVPTSGKPEKGFPAIVFLHGHLDPVAYKTLERYVAYQDGFAKHGFVTFKPDLRGHGKSEGEPVVSNFSEGYVVDALNLVAALKQHKDVDPNRIGMWGHSMGGGITLRSMVVSKDVKAGVMWAGVVGDWEDLLERYRKRTPWISGQTRSSAASTAQSFVEKYSSPSANPHFWNQFEPYKYLQDISGPVRLDHGTADADVPVEFSRHLKDTLEKAGKVVEYGEYQGGDHNLSGNSFGPAMQGSVNFFKKYL